MPLTEANRAGEFLLSEGNGSYSRETIVVESGQDLAPGTVLGQISVSGNYTAYSDGASDGSEVAAGILYGAVDATDGDSPGVAIVRQAEVSASLLVGSDANGTADLAASGIVLR